MTASRSVARRLVAAACVASGLPALLHAQQQPSIVERVDVPRVLIDARVVDAGGQPVLELGTDDFDVEIGGEPAPVESVVWVSGRTGRSEAELTASPVVRSDVLRQGRLVVLLFQKDMERGRIRGLMRMLVELRGFLDTFRPDDRVAVLSFDTYLKIWRDFTNDFDGVRDVLEHGILFRSPGPVREASAPSLLAHPDPARARHTYSIEQAFRLIGDALEPLAGSKSIVLVGHGFGFLTYGGVIMVNQYDETSEALQAARASVFSLDITDADFYSLELGLQTVSDETGGFFARTNVFTAQPLRRLEGALAGHYVLFVEKPPLDPGEHRIHVTLTRAKGRVLARLTFVG